MTRTTVMALLMSVALPLGALAAPGPILPPLRGHFGQLQAVAAWHPKRVAQPGQTGYRRF